MSGASINLSLTAKSYEGYSGEGALLEALSDLETLECADRIDNELNFEPKIKLENISASLDLDKKNVHDAM